MQIRSADGSGGDANDGVRGIDKPRVRHALDADVAFAMPTERLQSDLPLFPPEPTCCPAVEVISPVTIQPLTRSKSSSTWMSGSSPYSRAINAPSAPTGGMYSRVTMTSAP